MEQADRFQRGGSGEGTELEDISQKTYMQICITRGHGQQCGEGGAVGREAGRRWANGGGRGGHL